MEMKRPYDERKAIFIHLNRTKTGCKPFGLHPVFSVGHCMNFSCFMVLVFLKIESLVEKISVDLEVFGVRSAYISHIIGYLDTLAVICEFNVCEVFHER